MASDLQKLKILSVGPVDAGRSDILLKNIETHFSANYKLTVGCDCFVKTIKDVANLTIWDISSANRYTFIRKVFYKGGSGALLFFNRANKESWHIMQDWYNEIYQVLGPIPFILIGTYKKYENYPPPDATKEDFQIFAQTRDSIYIETSSEGSINLNSSLLWLANRIIDKLKIEM